MLLIELHIEQGPILEAEGKDIGVVTHGQGLWWLEITLTGKDALQYGNNPALQLLRIANLTLLDRALTRAAGPLDLAAFKNLGNQVFNNAKEGLNADLQALTGDAGQQQIAAWRKAVEVQDALAYNEPPDWYYTLRESLGYALLAQKRYTEAEQVFREDLAGNRLSGRSLNGLKLSLENQPGKQVPALLEEQLQTAWRNATVSPAPRL